MGERTSEMAGNVVTLRTGGAAVLPVAGETEVVCALAADVVVAEMVVEGLWVGEGADAVLPVAAVLGVGAVWGRRGCVCDGGRGGRRGKCAGHAFPERGMAVRRS